MEEVKNENTIDIYPTKVSRRLLCFLGDIFINFILTIFLFTIMVLPVSKLVVKYNDKVEDSITYSNNRDDILYEKKLLFFKEEEKYKFSLNLNYTADLYIESIVTGNNLEEHDIFYRYFVEIKKESVNFLNNKMSLYGNSFYDINNKTSLGTYGINQKTYDLLIPNYTDGDELSSKGIETYDNFKNDLFLKLFYEMIDDIKENDLTLSRLQSSYNNYTKMIEKNDKFLRNVQIAAAYISFAISCGVLFIAIPLTSKRGQTITEFVMKIEHVNKTKITYLKKNFILALNLFNIFNSSSLLFLVPFVTVGFAELFTMPTLYLVSAAAIVMIIIELIVLLSSNFAQSIKEFATDSIAIDTNSMNEYLQKKGYDV